MKTALVEQPGQDALYEQASADFGAALGRLARSYEIDGDRRKDLLQQIHLALWRSFAGFEGTCSIRTWVYPVAHNVAASHILRQRRHRRGGMVSLDDLEDTLEDSAATTAVDQSHVRSRLYALIHRLTPLDRQVILRQLRSADVSGGAARSGADAPLDNRGLDARHAPAHRPAGARHRARLASAEDPRRPGDRMA